MLTFMLANIANALLFAGLFGISIYNDMDDDDSGASASAGPVESSEDVFGTAGDDMLSSDEDNADFFAYGGNDTITGTIGSDYVLAGEGDDVATMGDGDDRVLGKAGNDIITLEAGNDEAFGGAGDDQIFGGLGEDELNGSDGADIIEGGEGSDTIDGGADADSISGDAGDDTLWGAGGADTLFGGEGDDVLNGASDESSTNEDGSVDGTDTLDGGDGDDRLILGASDQGTGGAGADTFSIDEAVAGSGLATVADFDPAEDVLSLEYTATNDADGNPVVPTVTVVDFADGSGAFIELDGVQVASVTGAQGLDPSAVVLAAA
ncbi:MAG: calcium-binding protein [Pseudomonadota bacterium]